MRRSHNAEEIAFSTRAMRAALEFANSLSADAILDMHRVLMAGQPRHTPGQWRDEPVWIGTRFAPPPPVDRHPVRPPRWTRPRLPPCTNASRSR